MAEFSGPFSDTTTFGESEWRALFTAMSPDGIHASHGANDLKVSVAGDGLSINVAAGTAVIQGAVYVNDSTINKASSANGGGSGRPDRAVLRYDPTANSVSIVVKEGTAGGTTAPALTQNPAGDWEIPLARWVRSAGGGITGLVDERQFISRDGRIVINDEAHTGEGGSSVYNLSALFPGARKGQVVLSMPSGREWRYTGSFWERIDPAPLLYVEKATAVEINVPDGQWRYAPSDILSGTFVAPSSGAVTVEGWAMIRSNGGTCHTQVRLTGPGGYDNTGNPDNNNNRAREVTFAGGTERETSGCVYRATGLTPGATYTATMLYAASGGSGAAFDLRKIIVRRA